MTNWYDLVSKDISKIPDAVEYFNTELFAAKAEIKISGRIEKASAHLPASVETRFSQLQEIEAILNYLNIELRRLRSSFFKKYLENYQRALSSRDVEKYVDGEADVVDYEKIINHFKKFNLPMNIGNFFAKKNINQIFKFFLFVIFIAVIDFSG